MASSPSEAKQFIAAYFEKYSGVRAFIDKTLEEARRDMKVKTLFGRVRPIPDINSKNANQRGFAERTAVNTPLQGTAADLIKIAMIRIDAALRERGMKSRMTLQVHDELVFEVPENEVEVMQPLVREHMEKSSCAGRAAAGGYGSGAELERSGVDGTRPSLVVPRHAFCLPKELCTRRPELHRSFALLRMKERGLDDRSWIVPAVV